MDLLFCDSFSHYDTAALALKYYGTGSSPSGPSAATPAVSIVPGGGKLSGTACYRVPAQTPAAQVTLAGTPGPSTPATFSDRRSIGANVRMTGTPGAVAADSGVNSIFIWYATGQVQVRLQWTPAGELMVSNGQSSSSTIGVTAGLGLVSGAWYHIAMKTRFDLTSGVSEVRVNGVAVLTANGATTGFSGTPFADRFALGNVWAAQTDFADVVVSGDDLFPGPAYVGVLRTAAAGAYSQWTPSAGAGWECVDDPAMNGDADYVASATAGHRSSYQVTPLVLPGTILAVQHVTAMRKDDAGVRTARQFVRVAGTDYDSVASGSPLTVTLTESYVMYRQHMSANPAGGAWTPAALNAAEPGVLVVS